MRHRDFILQLLKGLRPGPGLAEADLLILIVRPTELCEERSLIGTVAITRRILFMSYYQTHTRVTNNC